VVIGRGWQEGPLPPLDFENFSKKGCFLITSGKKQISPLLALLGEFLEKSPSAFPRDKILPTPMAGAAAEIRLPPPQPCRYVTFMFAVLRIKVIFHLAVMIPSDRYFQARRKRYRRFLGCI